MVRRTVGRVGASDHRVQLALFHQRHRRHRDRRQHPAHLPERLELHRSPGGQRIHRRRQRLQDRLRRCRLRRDTDATPTATASAGAGTPNPTPTPGCRLAISKTHRNLAGAGGLAKYRLIWSAACGQSQQLTITDTLPERTTFASAVVASSIAVQVSGNRVTLRTQAINGYGTATIRASIDPTAEPGTELCNHVEIADPSGNSAHSDDCLRLRGEELAQVLDLAGHSKSRPGRELSYTARYFNVPADNTLSLTLPEGVTVTRILDPQPSTVAGRTLTWTNLPIISGKVRVTVRLDADLPAGQVLPATSELRSSKGRNTANHDTLVVIPATTGGISPTR